MAERAIVSFTDVVDTFQIYMPSGGDIKTVAKTLENVRLPADNFKSALHAGEIAAEFLKQHRTKYPHTRLIANVNRYTWDSDVVYTIDVRDISVTIQQINFGKIITTPFFFYGTVEYFYKWADSNHDLHKAVDKIVKFVYKGGSGTQERIVKVNGQIRARLKKSPRTFCPVTLVAYNVTGEYFDEASYQEAAQAIKLRQREAKKIAEVSDCSPDYPKVREKLLKVTKLKMKQL
jgi:uncharacterized protein YoaH (UPF0181 family)